MTSVNVTGAKLGSVEVSGHADLAGVLKYGFDDIRNVIERSSARETAMRVAIGAICRKLLEEVGISIGSRVYQIHDIIDETPVLASMSLKDLNDTADQSTVRCLDKEVEGKMIEVIDTAKRNGDSVGGSFEVVASGLPYGLGSNINADGKLQARITQAMMSVNAFKGVELGAGFASSAAFGSELHDEILLEDDKIVRSSNNAGGIEGGMSNGNSIVVNVAIKPIATMTRPLPSVDILSGEVVEASYNRSDICQVSRACPVGVAMLALTIAEEILEKFGGDSLQEIKRNFTSYLKTFKEYGNQK